MAEEQPLPSKLWDGDEPLPTYEDMHIAKPLQLVRDQDDDAPEEAMGLGTDNNSHTLRGQPGEAESTEIQLTAEAICHHYIRAVQQATARCACSTTRSRRGCVRRLAVA